MDGHESYQELLDNYLFKGLTENEKKALEKELANNPSLNKEMHLHQEIIKGIEYVNQKRLKKRLKVIHDEVIPKIPNFKEMELPPQKSIWRKWVVAASLLGIIGILFWLFSKTENVDDLFASYYKPYSISFATRNIEHDENLIIANRLYNQGNYKMAYPLIQKMKQLHPDDDRVQLALGITQLELGQLGAAKNTFLSIIERQNPLFTDQGQWYYALTTLKSGDIEETKVVLKSLLEDSNADHYQEAQKLLNQLSSWTQIRFK